MIVAVADTHTIIWYLFNDKRLSSIARQTIETIGDKLSSKGSCQAGLGDKSRVGLARFGRGDLTIPKSRFSGAVR